MVKNKYLPFIFLVFVWGSQVQADSAEIEGVNNQTSLNLFLQDQHLSYSGRDGYYPLYNLYGQPKGLSFDFKKTWSHFFTALEMRVSNGSLSYQDSSLNLAPATSFVQQLSGRLGYTLYPMLNLGLTPYLTLGYQHWQLDTGGAALLGNRVNGITQVWQSIYYGIGLLGQWAANSRWVLGADFLLLNNYHAWTYATLPYEGNFFYQQATLDKKVVWQAILSSDYKLTSSLHGLLGLRYSGGGLGSGKTSYLNLTVPAQQAQFWEYSAGLGYALESTGSLFAMRGDRSALIAANNEVGLYFGVLFQDYGEIENGQPGYLDRETGQLPQVGLSLSKTWRNLYGQVLFSELAGQTEYNGSDVFTHQPLTGSTPTTMTDLSGRLGYQFFIFPQASITPYGIVGYHRWFRSIGYPETYHHNWFGWGALFQWAPSPRWVLSLDSNVGNSFHAEIHTWNTFEKPNTILFESKLGSRSYVMAAVGSDLCFAKAWHFLMKLNYWRFNYGAGPPVNAAGDHEPTSNTRLLGMSLGLGYAL